jgi:tetratricopeptide (TPR) repeat protein
LLYDNWHYIWSIRPELYDIKKDPGETENVVGQHSNVSQRLQDLLTDLAHDRQRQSDSVQQSETVERRQALGYVGGQPETDTVEIDEGLEDPKDFVEIYLLYVGAMSDKRRGDWEMARARCVKILDERPDSIGARIFLGHIAFAQGNHKDAVAHYSSVLSLVGSATADRAINDKIYQISQVYNNLAWIHATTQDPGLYDTERAVRFAEAANRRSGGDNAGILDTLAVAQAAAGNFKQAIVTAERALVLSDPDAESTAVIRKRIHLFRQSKPFQNE